MVESKASNEVAGAGSLECPHDDITDNEESFAGIMVQYAVREVLLSYRNMEGVVILDGGSSYIYDARKRIPALAWSII